MTVLLAVIGTSPAVLTETVWALATQKQPVVPDRVVVITTTRGSEQLKHALFSADDGVGSQDPTVWQQLRNSIASNGLHVEGRLRFGTTGNDIRVFTSSDDRGVSFEMEDIRSREDSELAAEFILEVVRSFADNPEIRLIASVAGGRKTMGVLLYASMTLLARETDRLTHVLVNEPYEGALQPPFYFPGQLEQSLERVHGGKGTWRAADARIELAEVPFVPLRNLFYRDLVRPGGFRSLVRHASHHLSEEMLEHVVIAFDEPAHAVVVDGTPVKLSARCYVALLVLATHAAAKSEEPYLSHEAVARSMTEQCARLRRLASAKADDWSDWRDELPNAVDPDDIRKYVSTIRKALGKELGDLGAMLANRLTKGAELAFLVPAKSLRLPSSGADPA